MVFGVVVDGFDVVKKIEACGSRSGTPSKKAVISQAGILPLMKEKEEEKKE